jgi:hypothetical protein
MFMSSNEPCCELLSFIGVSGLEFLRVFMTLCCGAQSANGIRCRTWVD